MDLCPRLDGLCIKKKKLVMGFDWVLYFSYTLNSNDLENGPEH
jgi:hypothetical protein